MRVARVGLRPALALLAASGLLLVSLRADAGKWVGTWVSAQQIVEPANMPPAPGLGGQSLRQIIQPALGGTQLRLTFSNLYGEKPLVVGAATVATSAGADKIETDSLRDVTFHGRREVTIEPGAVVWSDPITMKVQAFQNLAVTLHCPKAPATVTGHPGSRTTSYLHAGDAVGAPDFSGGTQTDHWYLLAAADVWTDPDASAIVVLGDSITDGRGSTTNQNDRWPNQLARRLAQNPRTAKIAVLNQGIGANRVLRRGVGPSALERFDRDVLVPPGVRWLVIFEGVNDLGSAEGTRRKGEPGAASEDLVHAYAQMIARAHVHGLKVYGATITPLEGFAMYDSARTQEERDAVNAWIRQPGNFDGVIDFDAIARDPQQPRKLSAAVDGGDHLHPSAGGYRVMAEAIDLKLFETADGK